MKATDQSVPALKIAVLGVGAIGSAFAFQFARVGGHSVTAIARPASARLQQLQRDGGIVNTKGERAEVQVMDALDEQIAYDLIVVTLLAHQVEAVLPALERCASRRIQFMFNNFEPERLQDAIGAQRSVFGMPFIQAQLTPDGRLNAKIGAGGQKCKMSDPDSVRIFNAAGLPSVYEAEMLLWLRCHVPLGAAFESVSYMGMQRGGGASWSEAMTVARGAQESWTLIQRLGYRLYPAGKARLHASPAWVLGSILWSMSRIPSFRALLATGVNECRALVDVLVANASRAEPPVAVSKIAAMKP